MRPTGAVACLVALAVGACNTSTTATTITTLPAQGEESDSFAPDPMLPFFAVNDTYIDTAPMDWETATPGEVGLDEALLEDAAVNVALSADIASLLVVREGKAVLERYFNGSDMSQANNVHSLSKSIPVLAYRHRDRERLGGTWLDDRRILAGGSGRRTR